MAALSIIPDGHGFLLSGELDMSNAAHVAAAFERGLAASGPLTVDMRQLRFMDSSGISAIIAAALGAEDACIILHGVHGEVQKVVELTRIDQLPNLHVMPCTTGVS